MNVQATIPLRPSLLQDVAGTQTGTEIDLQYPYQSLAAVLDLSAVGDNTQVADTLDVYVDAGYFDKVNNVTRWINIGRFTQITGVDAVKADGVLTLTGVIVPGSHAESVLTVTAGGNQIVDGYAVTIGVQTYTFKTIPLVGNNHILVGANDTASISNLKLAINHEGNNDGSDYYLVTATANPDVVATDIDATTMKIVARVPGTAANALATTVTGAEISWPDTTLGGGTGTSTPGVAPETVTLGTRTYSFVDVLSETIHATMEVADQVLFGADSAAALDNLKLAVNAGATEGTNYSTGTVAHEIVEATTNTNTEQTFLALLAGPDGNIASTTTIGNGSFAAATLEGGTFGPGVTDRQTLAWHNSIIEGTQPVNSDADLASAGVRKIPFGTKLRCRGVAAGAQPDFTYSVIAIAK